MSLEMADRYIGLCSALEREEREVSDCLSSHKRLSLDENEEQVIAQTSEAPNRGLWTPASGKNTPEDFNAVIYSSAETHTCLHRGLVLRNP